jgi:hypothetical protein
MAHDKKRQTEHQDILGHVLRQRLAQPIDGPEARRSLAFGFMLRGHSSDKMQQKKHGNQGQQKNRQTRGVLKVTFHCENGVNTPAQEHEREGFAPTGFHAFAFNPPSMETGHPSMIPWMGAEL